MAIKLKDPLILRDAAREYGVSYQWLRNEAQKRGTVRWQRMGKFVLVERADVEKVAADRQVIEKLLAARRGAK
jgi:hypothetical protein